jgi:hypothetical protein
VQLASLDSDRNDPAFDLQLRIITSEQIRKCSVPDASHPLRHSAWAPSPSEAW